MQGDDTFSYNFGISQAACSQWKGAKTCLDAVQSEVIKSEFSYIAWKAKIKIHCGKPHLAWEAYLSLDASSKSYTLLQMIANEAYREGHFFYALKAFDVLKRLDPSPEYWEGKRGACVGSFQMVLVGKEKRDDLPEIVNMLRNASNPQVEYILRVMKHWAKGQTINA
jgi:intraflagellar transport protein 56